MSVRGPAASRVYESVKRDLLAGQIQPGEKIADEALRTRLAVSRTPVREAMLALEQEQLVRIVPRQGYFAAELRHDDAIDAYQLRFLLEPVTAGMAAHRHQQAAIDELRELAHVTFDGSESSFGPAIERNKNFHLRICEIAGNARMTRAMAEALDALGRMALVDLKRRLTGESWTSEHLAIVEAIATRDPGVAAAAVRATFEPDVGPLLTQTRADISAIVNAAYRNGANS